MKRKHIKAEYGDGMGYADNIHQKTRKGGKGHKMANKSTLTEAKASKKYSKTRGEHFKDIVIAVLVTAVIAFVGGMVFAKNQQAEIDTAVKAAQAVATPQVEAVAPEAKK